MPTFFSDHQKHFSLKPLSDLPNSGFRPGQLGALHSVLAHFSINDDPAVVCLPTGYGKTAVMMALPFVLNAQRTLVIEPSDALRKQTTGHFKSLSTLRRLHVLEQGCPDPRAVSQKGRPSTQDDWARLSEQDVVVSTPQSTSPKLAPAAPTDLFDLVIFDEAHHAPAETWAAYLEHFGTAARFVFLTATPFRRDKRAIPGKIAYWYPVSKASREKAFGKVSFKPAPVENELNEAKTDASIAKTVAAQLKSDRESGFDHRVFVRAASIPAARALLPVYEAEGLKVEAIDSHISKKRQDECEQKLLNGDLDGIVCVDMFGEGYDFPKLKIAALHAPHRSLVPTLQFIGRFARTNDASTGDATLVAPVSRLRDATLKLFQEGVDIGELIDDAAREQLAESEADREILETLKTKRQAESDYDAVSPLSLELYAHTRIFACGAQPDFSLIGSTIGRNLKLAKQWTSDDGHTTLLLTVDHSPPNWATAEVLVNVRHDAFLFQYFPDTKNCFVGSTRRTEKLYLDLMQAVCRDNHKPLSFEQTRLAIAGLDGLRFYNVGLKNTAINTQAESYRVLTGPRAERAVTAGDARAFQQGHFFGSGVAGDKRETIGASSSSRVWSNRNLTVAEYLKWAAELNARLSGGGRVAESQLDLVHHAKQLDRLPDLVIGAAWNRVAYKSNLKVRFQHRSWAQAEFLQITDIEFGQFDSKPNVHQLSFLLEAEKLKAPFQFKTSGGPLFSAIGSEWIVEVQTRQDDWVDMASWLSMNPPLFFAGDKSSFQGVNLMRAPSTTITRLSDDDCVTIDWDGCAIDVEFEVTKANGKRTVHQHLEAHLAAGAGIEALIYDHRTGEAADYVVVQRLPDDVIAVGLYHCKGAGGKPSGSRVGDIYEVAGQVLKSIAYCEADALITHIENRINPHRHTTPSIFVKGDFPSFSKLLRETPPNKLLFEIYGVQPGVSKGAIDEHLADLMAFGLEYVQRGGAAKAAWFISP